MNQATQRVDPTDCHTHPSEVTVLDDGTPIYLQVASHISDQILAGDLQAHDRVMSTNEYASFFRINPATAAKGINMLVDDEVLYKRRGVGMFVADHARDLLLRRRREDFLATRVDALVAEARLVGIPVDELVDHIRAAHGNEGVDRTHERVHPPERGAADQTDRPADTTFADPHQTDAATSTATPPTSPSSTP